MELNRGNSLRSEKLVELYNVFKITSSMIYICIFQTTKYYLGPTKSLSSGHRHYRAVHLTAFHGLISEKGGEASSREAGILVCGVNGSIILSISSSREAGNLVCVVNGSILLSIF